MIRVLATVSDVNTQIANGYSIIRYYYDTDIGGSFSTLAGELSLETDVTGYEFLHISGSESLYYKTALWGSVPGEAAKSAAFQGQITMGYVTIAEVKSDINKELSNKDAVIGRAIDKASDLVDRFMNRQDGGFLAGVTATAKEFSGSGGGYQRIPECVEVTLVEVKDSPGDSTYTAWDATDWIAARGSAMNPRFGITPYTLLLVPADGNYRRFTSGRLYSGRGKRYRPPNRRAVPTVRITSLWGYGTTAPEVIRGAIIAQCAQWFKRGEGAWASRIGGANSEGGTLQFRRSTFSALDPDIRAMLQMSRLYKPSIGNRY